MRTSRRVSVLKGVHRARRQHGFKSGGVARAYYRNLVNLFALQPAATPLLLPGVRWLAKATQSFDTYDWKYGLEENVIEFLHACWERDSQRIASEPPLREDFLALLATLVARGSHAAIALRDRVINSIGG